MRILSSIPAVLAAGVALSVIATAASASPVLWEVDASSLDARVTGSFVYDADTGVFSEIEIEASSNFIGISALPIDTLSAQFPSTAGRWRFTDGSPENQTGSVWAEFYLTTGVALTNAGGAVSAYYIFLTQCTFVNNSLCSGTGNSRIDNPNPSGGISLVGTPISAPDLPPTAFAGDDQSVRILGTTVTLDGSASFDDNTASGDLQYAWQLTGKPGGSAAALVGANAAAPSFVADVSGTYTASLVVTDSIGQMSAADEVMVSTANLAPTADAGPDLVVPVGDIVILDGSASSDPEGMALSYAWTLGAVPAGSNATLANANSASPNLIPDKPGIYGATLVVSDDLGPGAPDSAEITAVARGDFASMKIACAADLIEGLPESVVKTKGNQKALLNYLAAAAKAVQRPDFDKAIERIEFALQRTDGCAMNGVPDGNGVGRDWVETCDAQFEIDRCLNAARGALE
ncbi:MAG TPA: PKD domain-containing protein [Amphiplicatus sp.]|nr:PKD domain-containing protein [Amphiplicatus sp.]HRX38743.1 PKD domain-containing protein [Parvularculaceae bacterium]